jgi:hypothetical protein
MASLKKPSQSEKFTDAESIPPFADFLQFDLLASCSTVI